MHGDLVYTAGQLPFVSGALPATGKVGDGHGLVPASDAASYARQSALNAIAAAAAAAGGVDKLTGVLKVTGFVASVPEFTGQPGVINGATRARQWAYPCCRWTAPSRSRSSSPSPEPHGRTNYRGVRRFGSETSYPAGFAYPTDAELSEPAPRSPT